MGGGPVVLCSLELVFLYQRKEGVAGPRSLWLQKLL